MSDTRVDGKPRYNVIKLAKLFSRHVAFDGMKPIRLMTVFAGIWTLAMLHLGSRLVRLDRKTLVLSDVPSSNDIHVGSSFRNENCAPCGCPGEISRRYVPGGVPEVYGRTRLESCIWPRLNESLDRVLIQMDLDRSTDAVYWIYVRQRGWAEMGNESYVTGQCPVSNCRISADNIQKADLILLREFDLSLTQTIRRLKGTEASGGPEEPRRTPPIVVWYMLESPINRGSYRKLNDLVNWTATYRRDSVINTPYERFTYYKQFGGLLPLPERNFAENKTKKVAAFISNCRDSNGRLDYARELKRYIDVDIYGNCGELKCPRTNIKPDPCYAILKNDYKFYLAFENSNCRHYITEKFFRNALL